MDREILSEEEFFRELDGVLKRHNKVILQMTYNEQDDYYIIHVLDEKDNEIIKYHVDIIDEDHFEEMLFKKYKAEYEAGALGEMLSIIYFGTARFVIKRK